jgi:hypothetical protein
VHYPRIVVLVVSVGLTLTSAAAAALGLVSSSGGLSARADIVKRADLDDVAGAGRSAAANGSMLGLRALEVEPRVPPVPARSGSGRRVVFDMSDQRVWLVRANGSVRRTYPVSGSKAGNLDAGRYEVYSRSRHATGYTGNTTMDYMVRFTTGDEAAIGFHDIPEDTRGRPVQGLDELGTATSAGCVRQRTVDAKQMWAFAPVGTSVVVVD